MLPAADADLRALLLPAGALQAVERTVEERTQRMKEMEAVMEELREAWNDGVTLAD